LGDALLKQPYLKSIMPVDTNIVIFELHDAYPAEDFVDKLAKKGVLCNTFGKQQVRLVTHLDVSAEMVEYIKQTLPTL
jgi:threonine aldolase